MLPLNTIVKVRWSMALSLSAAMVTLVAIVMLVVTLVEIRRERAMTRMDLEEQALAMSGTMEDVLRDSLYFLDINRVDATVSTAVRSSTKLSYIQVFRPDGSLLVDTREPDYPEGSLEIGLPAAVFDGQTPILKYTDGRLEVTSGIAAGRQTVGLLRVVFQPDLLDAEVSRIIEEHIVQAVVLFAIAVVLAFFLARYSTRPLRTLANAANLIGQGKLDHPVPAGGPAETKDLGVSLEKMRGELENLYSNLETEVAQRTRELTKTAQGLEQEIIERQSAQESLTLRNQELEALIETAGIMTSRGEFEEKCNAILENLVRILSVDVATLRIPDQSGEGLILEAAAGELHASRPLWIPLGPGLSARALSKGQAMIVNDYDSHSGMEPSAVAQGLKSSASIPINNGAEKTLGVITVGSLNRDHFTPERVKLLTAIVDRLGAHLNNADLSQELQSNLKELALVDEVSRIITGSLDIEQAYERFAEEMKQLTVFDCMTVTVADRGNGTFTVKHYSGPQGLEQLASTVMPLAGSQTGYVVTTGEAIVRRDISSDVQFNFSHDETYLAAGLRSVVMAPLISKGEVVGTIGLRSREVQAYGEREGHFGTGWTPDRPGGGKFHVVRPGQAACSSPGRHWRCCHLLRPAGSR